MKTNSALENLKEIRENKLFERAKREIKQVELQKAPADIRV